LFDQGDAGKGQAADGRGGQAYRPLPVLFGLHDHLPVGRALHAPGRSGQGSDRAGLYAAAAGAGAARGAGAGAATAKSVPRQHDHGAAGQAVCRPAAVVQSGGDARARARGNVTVWKKEAEKGGLDAILVTASGCGTVIKDYGYMLREDREYAQSAAQISALAKDITEYLAGLSLYPSSQKGDLTVAYHSACSLQHGQKITGLPKELLSKNGFVVKDVPESHLCCGSAGTYNILQPDIASRLRDRKIANIATVKPDMIAAGNIGCMV